MKDLIVDALLKDHNVEVMFSELAAKDLHGYDQNIQEQLIALIVKRARSGAFNQAQRCG